MPSSLSFRYWSEAFTRLSWRRMVSIIAPGGVCVLVGAAVFKAVVVQYLSQAGSIPVRLRIKTFLLCSINSGSSGAPHPSVYARLLGPDAWRRAL